jgi:hypothetical protein
MKSIRRLVLAFTLCVSTIEGQAPPTEEPRPAYLPFRYDEDWSFLSDSSKRSDWLDPLKHISLGRENWYATIGGEARARFELLDQPGFGTGPVDKNGYFLQRYLLLSIFIWVRASARSLKFRAV